jgi:DNA-binding HxlR family transcriptional regulator
MPDHSKPNDDGGSEIAEYLDRRGAIALLCTLSPRGSRFTELAEAVDVSRTTLSHRLEEGQEVSLIATVDADDDQRTNHEYVLTDTGARLRMVLNQSGLTTTHRLLTDYRRQFDEQAATVRAWVARHDADLRSEDGDVNARERLSELDDLAPTDG